MRPGLFVILTSSFAIALLSAAHSTRPSGDALASPAPMSDSAYIRQAESEWAESMASNDAERDSVRCLTEETND